MKEMMLQSEVYVFEADKMIQGFVGLTDEYIEGIFVSDEIQSCSFLYWISEKMQNLKKIAFCNQIQFSNLQSPS